MRSRELGYSFVRILPKETGVRPIVNLRRKLDPKGRYPQGLSINQILQATFQILTYEKVCNCFNYPAPYYWILLGLHHRSSALTFLGRRFSATAKSIGSWNAFRNICNKKQAQCMRALTSYRNASNLLIIFRPKLYFVKMDVRACYDTIDQNKLLGILKALLKSVRVSV